MIQLRPARMSDSDQLLSWRNDPVTCASFRSTEHVACEDHSRWMQFNVERGYPEHMVMIAERNFGSIGVIRFDSTRDDLMSYDISITVAPRHRGYGFGKQILSRALPYMSEFALNADVRINNIASRHIFEGCGFHEIGSDHGFIKYRKEPQA